ncbi:hypothetical protein L1987_41984 [Smallanthus sonchifolius]|uniref:Uncharacterized protein n=1 Tax=Smallanthus sonchifolius TaxID=185202 RepID=A0ACB9GWR8_9ASTR|nr:hypothetical protein L1987_41984 [Smallanthus sonchifolius]
MIVFRSREIARDFVIEEGWKEFFESMDVWNGEDLVFGRIVKLRMVGMPMGEIDISAGFCLVFTGSGNKIEEEVNLAWKNRVYLIWVSEVGENWIPKFGVNLPRIEMDGKEDVLEDGEFRPLPPSPAAGKISGREVQTSGCMDIRGGSQNMHGSKVATHVENSAHAFFVEMSSPGGPTLRVDSKWKNLLILGLSLNWASFLLLTKKKTKEI